MTKYQNLANVGLYSGFHYKSTSGAHAFTHVDHHDKEHMFATGGPTVQLWDTSRSEPVQSFEWGADSVTRVRFNPADGWPSQKWMRWPSDYFDGFVGFRGFRHPEEDDFPI